MPYRIRMFMVSAALLLFSCSAFSQASRTWVSGVGDDVNPCSRTAPCKTFAGAISKTAAGGIISVLDPGGFGGLTITKAITLDGGGIEGSITVAATNGITVNAGTDKVVLRNLSIYGAGTGLSGVKILSDAHVTIEKCIISGFTHGIEKLGSAGQINVHDSVVQGNVTYGIWVREGKATVQGVRFVSNMYGVAVDGSTAAATVRRSAAADGQGGFIAINSSFLSIDDSNVSNNAYGILVDTGAKISVANTNISHATVFALWNGGGQLLSFGNNTLSGNASIGSGFSGSAPLQ